MKLARILPLLLIAPTANAEEVEFQCGGRSLAAPRAFDAATGAAPEHLPAIAPFDVEHLRLEMDFPALDARRANVAETIILRPRDGDLREVRLHGMNLAVSSVEELGPDAFQTMQVPTNTPLVARSGLPFFTHTDGISILLPAAPVAGDLIAFRINYQINDPAEGLNWIAPLPNDPDPRWEVWSQGQPESNRFWFFAHDYPNDRFTSEIIARVPKNTVASAAGTLASEVDNEDGTKTFHWRMTRPHVAYLTTIVVGEFHRETADWRGVPLEYYVPPQYAEMTARTFANTPAMMETFSKRFGVDYPYARYAQVVVREFSMGGMENVTATTLTSRVLRGPAVEKFSNGCGENGEFLIAHELAHQWFGNLVTARNWSHLWLNEGWASYAEEIWAQSACGQERYDHNLWRRRERLIASDTIESNQPLVLRRLDQPADIFRFNGSAIYNKGAYLLHSLRCLVGDEDFFAATKLYLERFREREVETDNFRAVFEEVTKRDLEAWFRQYTERPGMPALKLSMDYRAAGRVVEFKLDQTQKIDETNPAFSGRFAIDVELVGGEKFRRTFNFTQRSERFTMAVSAEPIVLGVDPQGEVLASFDLQLPFTLLAETAKRGTTTFARLEAVKALGGGGDRRAGGVLRGIVLDDAQYAGVRREAALAIGKLSGPQAEETAQLLAGIATGPDALRMDYRVRAAIAEMLGKFQGDSFEEKLGALLTDPAEPVATAAGFALTGSQSASIGEALRRTAERRGEHDRIMDAALEALTVRGDAEATESLRRATAPDVDYRVRPGAVEKIGRYLEARGTPVPDSELTELLLTLTQDLRPGVRQNAVRALGRIRLPRARPVLAALASKSDDRETAKAAKQALTDWTNKPGSREDVKALEKRVAELEGKRPAASPTPTPEATPPVKKRTWLGRLFGGQKQKPR